MSATTATEQARQTHGENVIARLIRPRHRDEALILVHPVPTIPRVRSHRRSSPPEPPEVQSRRGVLLLQVALEVRRLASQLIQLVVEILQLDRVSASERVSSQYALEDYRRE
jgi:hypothetical protein